MKQNVFIRLVAVMLAVMLCLVFVGCNDDSSTISQPVTTSDKALKECSERDIRLLMEKNLDCVYCFFVADTIHPDNAAVANADGYYKAQTSFFESYDEFESFVTSVYTAEKSNELLHKYPSEDKPLYKSDIEELLVNPDAYTPIDYDVIWDDNYTVNITSSDLSKCEFELTAYTYDEDGNQKDYKALGCAVYEDGAWLLTDMVY